MSLLEIIEKLVQEVGGYSKGLVTVAAALGLVLILIYSLKIISNIYKGLKLYVFSRFCCQRVDLKERYGEWAVISGSTDGIGLALAKELARRGMSIIVIGRNDTKLAATKALLEKEPNVGQVMTVKIDLSDSSLENFNKIRGQIDADNRDIGILINNAGTYPIQIRRFANHDMEFLLGQINVNILATLHLTRMILPSMVARGKGLVVNVSSILGSIPTPHAAVYGPTKRFMDSFSLQLQMEYSRHPIDIVNLTPGAVQTHHMNQVLAFKRPTPFNPMPDDYARSALDAISIKRRGFISGCIVHGLCMKATRSYGWLAALIVRQMTGALGNDFKLSPVPKRKNLKQNPKVSASS